MKTILFSKVKSLTSKYENLFREMCVMKKKTMKMMMRTVIAFYPLTMKRKMSKGRKLVMRMKLLSKGVLSMFHPKAFYPCSIQMCCLFHIEVNFKLKFRGKALYDLLWEAGKSSNSRDFEDAMRRLKELSSDAHEWLSKIPKQLWSRHAFNPVSRVDHITNNIAESLNAWLEKSRELPILSLMEAYRLKVMKRLNSRYQRATSWSGKLVPHTIKRLNKEWTHTRKLDVISVGMGEYQVLMGAKMLVVNLQKWWCSYGRWTVNGIPCKHGIACIRMCNEETENYCHDAFTISTYFKIYSNLIHPQPDMGVLHMPTHDIMQPPPLRRLPGRPRKLRRMHASENVETQRSTSSRCSNCKQMGHNIRRCQRVPARTSENEVHSQHQSRFQEEHAGRPDRQVPQSETVNTSSQPISMEAGTTTVLENRSGSVAPTRAMRMRTKMVARRRGGGPHDH